jgi:hypothetical protein
MPAAMVTSNRHRDWIGHRLVDRTGVRMGTIEEVLIDPASTLTWLVVAGGRFGRRRTLVPVRDAIAGDERLWMPIERSAVRSAPRCGGEAAWADESFRARLYRHYGLAGLSGRPAAAPTTP